MQKKGTAKKPCLLLRISACLFMHTFFVAVGCNPCGRPRLLNSHHFSFCSPVSVPKPLPSLLREGGDRRSGGRVKTTRYVPCIVRSPGPLPLGEVAVGRRGRELPVFTVFLYNNPRLRYVYFLALCDAARRPTGTPAGVIREKEG